MRTTEYAPEPNRGRVGAPVAAAVLLGAAAAAVAVQVSVLEKRYLLALIAIAGSVVALPLLGSVQRVRNVLVAALCLGLSIGLSISFFLHLFIPGGYVMWAGGAEGVTITLALLAALGLIGISAFERIVHGVTREWRLSPLLVWPQLLFMAAGVLSLLNAYDATISLLEQVRLACLLLITLVAMNLSRRELDLFLRILALTVVFQAILAGVQFATGRQLGLGVFGEQNLTVEHVAFQSITRPTGTLGNANMLSYFFEITGPLMLAMFFVARNFWERLLFLAAAGAALGGMLVSLSRASWMTVPVTFGFITLAVYGRRLLTQRAVLIGFLLLCVAAVAAIYAYPLVATRLLGDDAGSASQRMPLNAAAFSVLRQYPLLGVGLNNFAVTFPLYDTTGYSRVFGDYNHVVHNLYMLVWTEVGTVGFAAFLWFLFSPLIAAFLISRRGDPWDRAVALGIAAGLCAHIFHGLFDPGFKLTLTISQLICALIGVLGCLLIKGKQSASAGALARGRHGLAGA